MRTIFLRKYSYTISILRSVALSTCQRWSILAPFLLYLIFFTVTKFIEVPLRSVDNGATSSVFMRRMTEKGGQLLDSGYNIDLDVMIGNEKEKPEPQVILEEIFHK